MVSTIFKQVRRFTTPKIKPATCHPAPVAASVTPSRYFRGKHVWDYVFAVLLLLPALPLMALCICLVRLTSRGPAIYPQCRVGRNGRIFCMYKIRSMKHNAEHGTGPAWTQAADPRVTRLGRFLRKFHLDELPQLFNVLQGEMSLVGPRPERPEFVEILSRRIPGYANRLAVKPGVTGLAQINLPPDSDLDSVRRKVMLDIEYIENANWWFDLRLILCTALRCTKLPIPGLFGVRRVVELPVKDADKSPARLVETVVTLKQFRVQLDAGAANGNGGAGLLHESLGSREMRKASAELARPCVRPLHAFTVDVEDYFQVSAFEECVPRDRWHEYPGRVEANTRRILELLAGRQVRATFFILGWVAKRYPRLVREIQRTGHEIGSHGFEHRLIYTQTPDEFREDIRRSADVLAEILGVRVAAYRAPSFSITKASRWALEILSEEGFTVDSSVVPIHHDIYGMPGAQAGLHRLETPSGALWEFPPAVYPLTKRFMLPVGGGGYFRIYPLRLSIWCLRQVERRRPPFMFYIHPWEVDPDQPRLPASFKSRFRHYRNLRRTLGKLDRLLGAFRFGPVRDVLAEHTGKSQITAEEALCLKS